MALVVKVPGRTRLSGMRKVAVETLGAPRGKPVFLLHGTPGGRLGPRPRGIILYRLGIRLITYDRPGYSDSDRDRGRSVSDAAKDVLAIADALGIDRFGVVGRSGGGPHALACAALLPERVACAAALGSLAPYDAVGLDWSEGMADSNVTAYKNATADIRTLITTLKRHAGQVRGNPESLLKMLWPELNNHDKDVIGDIAIRRQIAETHAHALRETADGWIDDVLALSRRWGFDVSSIRVPVMLWHGSDDVFSPINHTYWLHTQIPTAEIDVAKDTAHFGAVGILPKILHWVIRQMNAKPKTEHMGASPLASIPDGSRSRTSRATEPVR